MDNRNMLIKKLIKKSEFVDKYTWVLGSDSGRSVFVQSTSKSIGKALSAGYDCYYISPDVFTGDFHFENVRFEEKPDGLSIDVTFKLQLFPETAGFADWVKENVCQELSAADFIEKIKDAKYGLQSFLQECIAGATSFDLLQKYGKDAVPVYVGQSSHVEPWLHIAGMQWIQVDDVPACERQKLAEFNKLQAAHANELKTLREKIAFEVSKVGIEDALKVAQCNQRLAEVQRQLKIKRCEADIAGANADKAEAELRELQAIKAREGLSAQQFDRMSDLQGSIAQYYKELKWRDSRIEELEGTIDDLTGNLDALKKKLIDKDWYDELSVWGKIRAYLRLVLVETLLLAPFIGAFVYDESFLKYTGWMFWCVSLLIFIGKRRAKSVLEFFKKLIHGRIECEFNSAILEFIRFYLGSFLGFVFLLMFASIFMSWLDFGAYTLGFQLEFFQSCPSMLNKPWEDIAMIGGVLGGLRFFILLLMHRRIKANKEAAWKWLVIIVVPLILYVFLKKNDAYSEWRRQVKKDIVVFKVVKAYDKKDYAEFWRIVDDADDKNPKILARLGHAYFYGLGKEYDYRKARRYYKRLLKTKDPRYKKIAEEGFEKASEASMEKQQNESASRQGLEWTYGICKDGAVSLVAPAVATNTSGQIVIPSILVGRRVTRIGNRAFAGCRTLNSVVIPDGICNIGDSAFIGCHSLDSVTVPASVMDIGDYAFGWCKNLKRVTIPNQVKNIGRATFMGCTSIESVSIPSSVTNISFDAFHNCSSLVSVELPLGVKRIGFSAFAGCTSLTSVTIPSSVTTIEGHAFSGCERLSSLRIPSSVALIGGGAFSRCGALKSFVVDAGNPLYCMKDGMLLTKDGKSLLAYPIQNKTSVAIPEGVECIRGHAFAYSKSLVSVIIPSSVTQIGQMAFWNCKSLKTMKFFGDQPSVGSMAFHNVPVDCTVIIPSDNESWKDVGEQWMGMKVVREDNALKRNTKAAIQAFNQKNYAEFWELVENADRENVGLIACLADAYCNGFGLASSDFARAASLYEKLGKKIRLKNLPKVVLANLEYNLACCYHNQTNYIRAAECAQAAIKHGSIEAWRLIAEYNEVGEGGYKKDLSYAAKCYEKALLSKCEGVKKEAKDGLDRIGLKSSIAERQPATVYRKTPAELEKDARNAFAAKDWKAGFDICLKLSKENVNDPYVASTMGLCYLPQDYLPKFFERTPYPTKKDFGEAYKWLKHTVDLNPAYLGGSIQYMLGDIELTGRGSKRERKKAIEWFKLSAAQNFYEGCFKLGECYEKGLVDGDENRLSSASNWYYKALSNSSRVDERINAYKAYTRILKRIKEKKGFSGSFKPIR